MGITFEFMLLDTEKTTARHWYLDEQLDNLSLNFMNSCKLLETSMAKNSAFLNFFSIFLITQKKIITNQKTALDFELNFALQKFFPKSK